MNKSTRIFVAGHRGLVGSALVRKLTSQGYSNLIVRTKAELDLINQALEYGDSGLRSCVSVQSGLVMYPIYRYGTEEQREYWLPKLALGEAVGCYGLTEPDHGSDPGGMVTRAMPVAGGFVLNGAKAWITNGGLADVAMVWAKVGEGGSKSIRGFFLVLFKPHSVGTKSFTLDGKVAPLLLESGKCVPLPLLEHLAALIQLVL